MKPLDPRLLRHARTAAIPLAALVGLGVLAAGLVIAQADLLATGLSVAIRPGPHPADLTTVLTLLALVVAARAGVALLASTTAGRAATTVKTELRQRLLRHTLRLGPRWLPTDRTGHLSTLATRGIDALDGYLARYLPQLLLAVLVPAAILARLLAADPVAAATVVLTLPLIPVFLALVGLATRAATRRRLAALSRLAHHFLDVVAGLPTLAVFGRAHRQADTIRRVTDQYRRTTGRTLRLAFLSSLVLELLSTLSVALVAVGIGLRLLDGHLTLRTALLVLVLAPEAYLPLRQLGTHFHASTDGLAAAEEIFHVLETPTPQPATGGRPAPATIDRIHVHNLRVCHPDRPRPAPDGITLHLAPGTITAVTGPSGCGKSTLIAALLGFTTPDSGHLLVNDTDLATLDPDSWRAQIAWTAQDPHLRTGTIADNIRLGRPDAPERWVQAAGRDAALDLPLDRTVGEHGSGLSAGQRRRVALARAFLREAPVLLLDEPTAGLDPDTEAVILGRLRALAAAGRTILLVTHRPAALPVADHLVDLTPAPTP